MPLIPKLPAAAFFACSLVACGTSPGTFDGAVGPDAGTDEVGASETGADDVVDAVAPRPPTPGACARFDEISATAVNGPFEVGGISRSVSGTCFDPLESTDETDGTASGRSQYHLAPPWRSPRATTVVAPQAGESLRRPPCAESTAVDCRWGSEIYERSQEGVRGDVSGQYQRRVGVLAGTSGLLRNRGLRWRVTLSSMRCRSPLTPLPAATTHYPCRPAWRFDPAAAHRT
jgi:hypothetical protein